MPKWLYLFMCTFMVIFLSACRNKNIQNSSDIENTFESNVKINYGGKKYECELSHTPEHINIVKILQPENLRGLTFSWENSVCEVSWHNLKCEFSKEILPENSFISEIVDALNWISSSNELELCTQEGDYKKFKGKCDAGEFEVSIDKDGFIKKLIIPNRNVDADFSIIDA